MYEALEDDYRKSRLEGREKLLTCNKHTEAKLQELHSCWKILWADMSRKHVVGDICLLTVNSMKTEKRSDRNFVG